MRKFGFIFTLLIFLASPGFAQFDLVSRALGALQANKLAEAKEYIDSAYTQDRHANEVRMWYYRGYIYKDLYKQDRTTPQADGYRKESLLSFRKTLDLDEKKEFTENVRKIITYLTSTLYNDAATALEEGDVDMAIRNYGHYKKVMKEFVPRMDFTGRDIQFKLVLASVYSVYYDESDGTDTLMLDKIKGLYEDVLTLDSNNVSANYNLGILYYNQAVSIIEQMDYDMALVRLYEIQEQCISLFLKALPYMRKAYKLNPQRKETLIGLSGIYFSLNDIERSEAFKEELEKLGGADDLEEIDEPQPTPSNPQPEQSGQPTEEEKPDEGEDAKGKKKKDKKKSKKDQPQD